jgi:hypothetical protein
MAYVGYDTAGYNTVSRAGVRRRRMCGTDATSSFVPTHAATDAGATSSSPNRRISQRVAASRSCGLPAEAGYPRSVPDDASASTTAGSGGSHGVPMEQSTIPPSCDSASLASPASRS